MDKIKIKQFFDEFNALQEKYGIRVQPDHKELIDYDWDEEPYVSGIDDYLTLYNYNCTIELGTIHWDNELTIL